MTSQGSAHPLDVDLADLVDGIVDQAQAARLEAHLADCVLCRVKRQRLRGAPPPTPTIVGGSLPSPPFAVPGPEERGEPAAAEIWLAGSGERILVLVVRAHGDRVLVAPVTLDVEAADDETVVVDAGRSPLRTALAVHPALAVEVPRAVLAGRVAAFATDTDLTSLLAGDGPGLTRGAAIHGATDPRLELRQLLADRLGSLEETPLDPASSADAPSPGLAQVRSALISDLRSLRGTACGVRAMDDWDDLFPAHRNGWVPMATVDELGVVLVVLDTPHGLVDDREFDAARSVLTRFNATALVVLALALSELADVFDSSSLNYGIDMPSGAHTPPRPLISGLTPSDAIAKYLDQHTGAHAVGLPSRGPITRVDVGAILREAAAAAAADAVRQGSRFKIAPKRGGYESLADVHDALGTALGGAFTDASVVEDLLNLARRNDE